MAQANPYPLRIEEVIMEKIKQISKNNGRSVNKEIEFSLKQYISEYEKINGVIQVDS